MTRLLLFLPGVGLSQSPFLDYRQDLALYRLLRRRHPRWVGMQVGPRDLTLWSFLMASAHGAGLMLLPFVLTYPLHAMPDNQMHDMMRREGAGTIPHESLPLFLPPKGSVRSTTFVVPQQPA